VLHSPRTRRLTAAVAAVVCAGACATAVAVCGELSTGALLAVAAAGAVVVAVGLTGRAGAAAPPVGRGGLPWLGWLALGLAAEVVALLDDDLPTLSDLADPLLAHPLVRAAATAAWLGAGAWLVTRPGPGAPPGARPGRATAGQALAAAMRTTPGRVAVLLAWAWLGLHFLAR
jgi:hypothetical protein